MIANVFRFLRRLRRPAGVGLATGLPVLLFGCLHLYESLADHPRETLLPRGEIFYQDLLRLHGRSTAARGDMVYLGVDDSSLQLDGLWPDEIEASPALKLISESKGAWDSWSREIHARLLDRLAEAGARLVIFDLVFVRPKEGDEAFRAALDRHKDRVVIASQFVGDPPQSFYQPPADTLVADPSHDPRVGYASYFDAYNRNGTVRNRDGKIRWLSFFQSLLRYNNNAHAGEAVDTDHPSLASAALQQMGRSDLIPSDHQARLFRYTDVVHNEDYFPRPVWEVFADSTWQSNYGGGAFFKGKIVIVGASAPTLHDFVPTPYGNKHGPAVHLQSLTAAMAGEYLRLTSLGTELLVILLAGIAAWLVGMFVRHPLQRQVMYVVVSVAYVALTVWLYNRFGLLLLALTPLLVFNTGGIGNLLGSYIIERAEKARVRGVLDRLVSKDIVRELLTDREKYEALVRGQRRAVTVLFSDVRGFTTLSEAAGDTAAFIRQLNEYLGEMVDIVFKHRGTLDKFIGDAVMAVWGSMHTEGIEADARAAVAAGVEMREKLASLNVKWAAEGKLPFDFGIGLNHGEVIVGGLGSIKSKLEITVMGDAVNLASRIEGLTKEYGLDMLIGESVARLVSETFRLRTVDLVTVKGKKKPSEVMAVIGPLTQVPSEAQEFMFADYEDAILLYRKQEFAAAARMLEECLKVDPKDQLAALYLERCHELIAEAPPADWDGVRKMTTK